MSHKMLAFIVSFGAFFVVWYYDLPIAALIGSLFGVWFIYHRHKKNSGGASPKQSLKEREQA